MELLPHVRREAGTWPRLQSRRGASRRQRAVGRHQPAAVARSFRRIAGGDRAAPDDQRPCLHGRRRGPARIPGTIPDHRNRCVDSDRRASASPAQPGRGPADRPEGDGLRRRLRAAATGLDRRDRPAAGHCDGRRRPRLHAPRHPHRTSPDWARHLPRHRSRHLRQEPADDDVRAGDGCGRPRTGPRLRECSQPPAGAIARPPPRDRRVPGDRRQPSAHRPAAARRGAGAVRRGRRRRARPGGRADVALRRHAAHHVPADSERRQPRPARGGLHDCHVRRDRLALRQRAGVRLEPGRSRPPR